MGGVILLGGVALAGARQGGELTEEQLRGEMARNRALASYVGRNGMPDLAESHFLADRPPWDDHEVTIYYLDMRKEIAFARAYILGRPEVQIVRYERPLTDEQVAALATRVRPGRGLGPAERAEASALRAEEAAGRVEAAAESAERAADKTEAIASKMESAFHRALKK
jgi:hypothetical protein